MNPLFRLPAAVRHDPRVADWFKQHGDDLGRLAQHWFDVMRGRGGDVCEIVHDNCPTACVGDAAFAYVGVYRKHVSVGFFRGAFLPDPKGLLEGSGRNMRHVKLPTGAPIDAAALSALIESAYWDMKSRVAAG